mmetsp:Transcript_794/g.1903  ORF Transcript_794/g.1903 Transcript_794/m.1903 type:complete len:237 (-) Transcript_794:201-911(-)
MRRARTIPLCQCRAQQVRTLLRSLSPTYSHTSAANPDFQAARSLSARVASSHCSCSLSLSVTNIIRALCSGLRTSRATATAQSYSSMRNGVTSSRIAPRTKAFSPVAIVWHASPNATADASSGPPHSRMYCMASHLPRFASNTACHTSPRHSRNWANLHRAIHLSALQLGASSWYRRSMAFCKYRRPMPPSTSPPPAAPDPVIAPTAFCVAFTLLVLQFRIRAKAGFRKRDAEDWD